MAFFLQNALRGASAIGRTLMTSVVIHPLDPDDAKIVGFIRAASSAGKGKLQNAAAARAQFDALMEGVAPRDDVKFEAGTLGGISGVWVHPTNARPDEAILHLHGGWFSYGSANAYRHLVGQIAARVGTKAFIPDYRLAPEHPFPAAIDDTMACYRALGKSGVGRIAVTGDSAGGDLALVLASQATNEAASGKAVLVGVAALSPVTDLTLSGESYTARADADPFFTREQVAELVRSYLGGVGPRHPLASPLYGPLSGLPPIRVHVGDAEVLLDDSRRYVESAVIAGVDARLDVWTGMPHGFQTSVGKIKVAAQSLDEIGAFLSERLQAHASP
jgi:monoterpene epsilon-lactone hydrolase